MTLHSAGLLPFTRVDGRLRVFIVHMGGPFWGHRDAGGWSLAKGMYVPGEEEPTDAARREFAEEVGAPAPDGELLDLGEVRLSSGKRVRAFAVESSGDLAFVASNTFEVEWPRRSGRVRTYPEVDRADWFDVEAARRKLTIGQVPLLDALLARLAPTAAQEDPCPCSSASPGTPTHASGCSRGTNGPEPSSA